MDKTTARTTTDHLPDAAAASKAPPRRCRRPGGLLRRLLRDESGAEILEYVLIAGLVIVGTIAVVASFGTKVLARWTSVNNSF